MKVFNSFRTLFDSQTDSRSSIPRVSVYNECQIDKQGNGFIRNMNDEVVCHVKSRCFGPMSGYKNARIQKAGCSVRLKFTNDFKDVADDIIKEFKESHQNQGIYVGQIADVYSITQHLSQLPSQDVAFESMKSLMSDLDTIINKHTI